MKQEVASNKVAARPLCVVLDTNVWRSEVLLRSRLGVALLYAVRASNGRLGLPEVVSEEIEKHIVRAGAQAAQAIVNGFATIEKIVGYRSRYSLPSEEVVRRGVSARLAELAPLLDRVSFTLEHAKGALRRVNEETPPNGYKNQQFKDSAIWEAVLDLARERRVCFVTGDKGFFASGDYSLGLAKVLRDEVAAGGGTVEVYPDLKTCLAVLRSETPPVDESRVGAEIDRAIRKDITDTAASRGFQVLAHVKTKVEAFLTERDSVLALSFDLTYQMADAEGHEGLGRTEAMAYARGECSYSLERRLVTDFDLDEIEFVWRDENLQMQRSKNIYVRVGDGLVFGDGVNYTLREPLAEG